MAEAAAADSEAPSRGSWQPVLAAAREAQQQAGAWLARYLQPGAGL
jgi:hypothetical protein